jgi:hypothetical protein
LCAGCSLEWYTVIGDATTQCFPRQDYRLCVIDPPWGVMGDKMSWDKEAISESAFSNTCRAVIGGNVGLLTFAVFCSDEMLSMITKVLGLHCNGEVEPLIWVKTSTPNMNRTLQYQKITEHCVLGFFNPATDGKRDAGHLNYLQGERRTNVMTYPHCSMKVKISGGELPVNACQKPVYMLKYLVDHYTKPGDWILDLFSGVGVNPCLIVVLCVFIRCFMCNILFIRRASVLVA